ncbi:hypothetical protein M0R45_035300 [Rubus argutus]|uniref:Uncharacterized protein n=1 Tax=Rubus argutus TaxID=59490 RepID=A0AAW1VV68_RUBAR
MGTIIRYNKEAGEVKVERAIVKSRCDLRSRAGQGEDPAQKISNSLQISKPREINIRGGVLEALEFREIFRYVKSGYGHSQGENPTQEIHIQAGGTGKSTDDSPARSLEDESDDDDTGLPHIFDDGYYAPSPCGDPDLEGPLAKCGLCRQTVSHSAVSCPYLYYVPHNVSLPRGYERACKGCGKKDGHPGREWDGYAVLKYCFGCFEAGDHWADDPDCPKKKQRLL